MSKSAWPGAIDVDEHGPAAAFQGAARFPKPGLEVLPVMGGEPGGDKVEHLVFKREPLGRGFSGLDVAEALLARRLGDRRQHLGRQIRRNDPPGMARENIGDVAPAGAEIERQLRAELLRQRSDRVEVRPLTVDRALDIGFRSRTELGLDNSLMGLDLNGSFAVPGLLRLNLHCYKIESYPIITPATLEADQRRLLGEFVRAHRERVQPTAAAGRRRTSGLRREELAAGPASA